MRKTGAKAKRRDAPMWTPLQIAMASTTHPMPQWWRAELLGNMRRGLEGLRTAPAPGEDEFRCVADSVNLIETMERLGWIDDIDATRIEAETALAEAAARYKTGKPLRLTGPGLAACEALIDAFEEVAGILSARNMMIAVVEAERAIRAIMKSKRGETT